MYVCLCEYVLTCACTEPPPPARLKFSIELVSAILGGELWGSESREVGCMFVSCVGAAASPALVACTWGPPVTLGAAGRTFGGALSASRA